MPKRNHIIRSASAEKFTCHYHRDRAPCKVSVSNTIGSTPTVQLRWPMIWNADTSATVMDGLAGQIRML
eukprot:XP_001704020.1 Hypothetical protein GL50803_119599 [Giardia lamblia ATCC 50803]